VTHYSETVGHLEIAVVEKGDETRLTFRTSWGTGLTIPTDRIPEIIHALKGAERATRRAHARTVRDGAA
jgi:hypothetical protein